MYMYVIARVYNYIIIYCITYFYVGNIPIIYVICTYIVCNTMNDSDFTQIKLIP